MRLFLINPRNALVPLVQVKENRFNKYSIWKPLGLLILARVTPPEWEITVIDENIHAPDYASLPRPDLVGLTAFTSQAGRAYELAGEFRNRGVPVVMGGIHATMCVEEALGMVDAVVTREAEEIWPRVLEDVRNGALKRIYSGGTVDIEAVPPPDTICRRRATPSDQSRPREAVRSIAISAVCRRSTAGDFAGAR